MHIALVAPPFIPVPPPAYGGTELFVANLAEALSDRGHDVVVYANGASRVRCPVRWTYAHAEWPLPSHNAGTLKSLDHAAWALADCLASGVDIVHTNDAVSVPLSRFLAAPVVHTLHHPFEPELAALYGRYPDTWYVAISDAQRRRERMPRLRTIHHGLRLDEYRFFERKDDYLLFLGRIAPVKGAHIAIEAARRAGRPLKLAGEIQPMFRDYWESKVKPYVDGVNVEYVGEANHARKNELLGAAAALLFPIQWNEPFGLVMIEAMACGTPVIALSGGSVDEIVRNGISGWICRDADDMGRRAVDPGIAPAGVRREAEERFSVERMAAEYEDMYMSALEARNEHEEIRHAAAES
jgi:glycosyltransferase involved in cell wall biosynthesis